MTNLGRIRRDPSILVLSPEIRAIRVHIPLSSFLENKLEKEKRKRERKKQKKEGRKK